MGLCQGMLGSKLNVSPWYVSGSSCRKRGAGIGDRPVAQLPVPNSEADKPTESRRSSFPCHGSQTNLFLMINASVSVKLRQLYGESRVPSQYKAGAKRPRARGPRLLASSPSPRAPETSTLNIRRAPLHACSAALTEWLGPSSRQPRGRRPCRDQGSNSGPTRCCVTLIELLNLSELQLPHLQNEDINNTHRFSAKVA